MSTPSQPRGLRLSLALFAPGMLIAATGVGAGDLLTASLAGSRHGLALLWAAWFGALLKWFLNEGIARWQMATGTTLLEGAARRLSRWVRWGFLLYILPWTVFVGGALASACGVAGNGLFPLSSNPQTSKILWGVIHSVGGGLLVWRGGFKAFERLMALSIILMFAGVVITAPLLAPDWKEVVAGLFVPRVPEGGTAYAFGVLGGVGGTVTLLSYGYWVRRTGRNGIEGARDCRIDLAGGYFLTGLFGMCMIVIGSRVTFRQGPNASLELADQIALILGAPGKWIFLLGFWGAVYSSLLGVWESVPYMFADFVRLNRPATSEPDANLSRTAPYKWYLLFISTVPMVMLWTSLQRAQLLYAVFGAFFMPLLALALLLMNTREGWVGKNLKNGWLTNAALIVTLAVFGYLAWGEIADALGRLLG